MQPIAPSVEELFFAALELEGSEARSAFLDGHCGDAAMRRRVEELLAGDARGGDFLESPASTPTVTTAPDCRPGVDEAGAAIGPYKLLEQIGEGGMGTVYMAEQSEPVRRLVALKVIKPGMDSKQVVSRFEAERQALAMMDHPNIARVLDGGTTDSGRPFFVMDLVRGLPITEYCDRHQLSIAERLELFVLVCRAVQHAHQKGIIHRDLKPSNVLVTDIDGVATPKVIDFGVAKATGQALTDKTLFTGFHQFVGTPLYTSPEQAELSGVDVDTRSDIYSLGVLMYELLTGTTPFDSEKLRRAAFDEMRRIIREEEPLRPSTRLSSLGDTLTTVSARRKADPRRLSASMKGELDWVVMKALEKDRRRRYETANDFAADVMRHLTDRPVEACPPSARYRLGKFARRNRAALTTAGVVALGLAAATAFSSWQAIIARRARAAAVAAEGKAERRLDEALAAKRRADEQAAITKAINEFFLDDLMGQANVANQEPSDGRLDPDVKVRTLLDRAADRISSRFGDRPFIEAEIRQTISDNYRALGLYTEALPHQQRAVELRERLLGAEAIETLSSRAKLAMVHLGRHEAAKAELLLGSALEAERRVLGTEHELTLDSQNDLALVYKEQGKLAEAERLLVANLAARERVPGPADNQTLTARSNLADIYFEQGRFAEAEPLLRATLAARRRLLPADHPDLLATQNNLALVCRALGRTAEAESLHRATLETARRVLGPDHVHTLTSLESLATLYEEANKPAEAEPLCRELVEQWRRRKDFEGTINTVHALERLGRILLMQEKYAEAEPPLRECVAICDSNKLKGSGRYEALGLLGGAILGRGDHAAAEPLLLEAYEGMKRIKRKISPDDARRSLDDVAERLVRLYEATDRQGEAAKWREDIAKRGGPK